MKLIQILAALLLPLVPQALAAAELDCSGAPNVEEYHYSWHLRGGLGWVAGFVFPRSGFGDLKTTYRRGDDASEVESELLITPGESKSGFYVYESKLLADASRTLTTYHGYSWGDRSRKERTVFDYTKHLARVHKETPTKTEDTVNLIRHGDMRDVLTAIHFLRTNAETIGAPVTTSIYSDGKEYDVVFRRMGKQTFNVGTERVSASGFEIVDAPGGKRWPGGVRVWISDDGRRIPFRIEIVETFASLRLDLDAIRACGFMNAQK